MNQIEIHSTTLRVDDDENFEAKTIFKSEHIQFQETYHDFVFLVCLFAIVSYGVSKQHKRLKDFTGS